jgi:hypothetical protein
MNRVKFIVNQMKKIFGKFVIRIIIVVVVVIVISIIIIIIIIHKVSVSYFLSKDVFPTKYLKFKPVEQ